MARTRRDELVGVAARLFAERGYHGTSMADLAAAMGVQKGSLYSLTESKQELLVAVARDGATAFHAALDRVPDDAPPLERIRAALRGHLATVAAQVDAATVFTREWRFLEEPERAAFRAERRRYEERWRELLARRPPSAARSAPTSTSTRPSCSSCRPRTGRTPGSGPARTRTRSPTGSSRSSSTGSAATPRDARARP